MSSEGIQLIASVEFSGGIKEPEDISAIAQVGSFLVIGSDEAVGDENFIQVLKEVGPDHYEVHRDILLFEGNKKDGKELDIEGIAVEADTVYVVGSHSARRKLITQDKKYKKNRRKLQEEEIDDRKNRAWLFRLTIDDQGRGSGRKKKSLRKIIKNDRVLKTFSKIPSKENGVDIEGIAAKGEWLYVGFRGPVLRGNYVPVMKLKFDEPAETYELLYVNLAGRGFRDIKPVSDGFLIVAGPVGYGPGSHQLYHWDGKDVIPGKDRRAEDIGKVHLLGEIRPPKDGRAEGILVLQEEDTSYELIIVYDGIKDDAVQRVQVAKNL
jgi:hypothetical protein